MNNKPLEQEEFSLMLENYRHRLQEMNALTTTEIGRVKALESSEGEKPENPPKAAVQFINNQLFSYLDHLVALAGTIPDYTVHGCFTKEECSQLQERALDKLKKLGYSNPSEK